MVRRGKTPGWHCPVACLRSRFGVPSPMSRILLVDDHSGLLQVWAALLCRIGHEVHTASRIGEARAKARMYSFDLVVLDLDLPDGCAGDLLAELAGERATPVIAVSELSSDDEIRDCLASGFALHLRKPVRLEQLQAALQSAKPAPGDAASASSTMLA